MPDDYISITELPGSGATSEQLARLYHRYHTARSLAQDKRVLEVACGPGLGLGYMAKAAKRVVGGDYTDSVLRLGQSHYCGQVPLLRLDAQHLPFHDGAFDLVVMFEAIYYLQRPEEFVAESRRVLSDGGILLISTVNKDWSEFSPSSFSTRYFSVPELRDLFMQQGFGQLEFYAAFPTAASSPKQKLVSLVRRVAVSLNMVPETLGGRERLKRFFYGGLKSIKPEVEDDMAASVPMVSLPCDRCNSEYKILYAIALAQ